MASRPDPQVYHRPITPSDWWMLSSPRELAMEVQLCVEGDGAINNIRQRTAREPIVQVEDENHKPVDRKSVV